MSDDKPTVKKRLNFRGTDPVEQLKRAKKAAAEMEEAAEQLNQTLLAAEKKFAQLRMGVYASHQLWVDHDDGRTETLLCFGKENNEWKLYLQIGDLQGPPEEYEAAPLMKASRETRACAVQALPDLFDALVKAAEQNASYLKSQVEGAKEFLQELEAK